jgi:hypothetical protein
VTAFNQLTPQEQARVGGLHTLAQGDATTQVSNVTIQAISEQSLGVELVTTSFTTTQAPANSPDAAPCDNWSLVYTVIQTGGSWLIADATGVNGAGHVAC